MTTDTRNRIIDYIRDHGQARAYDLQKTLQLSNVAVHKQLKKLLQEGAVVRVGKPPLVFYTLPPQPQEITRIFQTELLSAWLQQTIEANFLSITPDGRLLYGM